MLFPNKFAIIFLFYPHVSVVLSPQFFDVAVPQIKKEVIAEVAIFLTLLIPNPNPKRGITT